MHKNYLSELMPGEEGIVAGVEAAGGMRRRLMDIGLTRGTRVRCVGRSPMGDPSAYLVRGAVIAIRATDARGIALEAAK